MDRNILDIDNIAPPGGRETPYPHAGEHPLLIVHMMQPEVEALIALQGGKALRVNKGALKGMYTFPELAPMFDNPQVKQLFAEAYTGKKRHQLRTYEQMGQSLMPNIKIKDSKDTPGLKATADKGIKGDNMLVQIPMNLARFLVEIKGGKKPPINPETGLLQFLSLGASSPAVFSTSFNPNPATRAPESIGIHAPGDRKYEENKEPFNNLIGAILTTAGAKVGGFFGQTGADVGTTLAHLVHNVAKGNKFADILYPTLKDNLGPTAQREGLPLVKRGLNQVGNAASNALKSSTSGHDHTLNSLNGFQSPQIKTNVPKSKGFWDSLGDVLTNPKTLELAQTGLAHLGSQRDFKNQEKMRQRQIEELRQERERSGIDKPFDFSNVGKRRHLNPDRKEGETHKPWYIYEGTPEYNPSLLKYASGGSVNKKNVGFKICGPGKGQDDLIKTDAYQGDWINDSSLVSMLGDGDTNAGTKALHDFFTRHTRDTSGGKKTPKVKVALSAGEVKVPAARITYLGGGSNEKGAQIMREFTHRVRAHKISNGTGLPPKAHDPEVYFFGKE